MLPSLACAREMRQRTTCGRSLSGVIVVAVVSFNVVAAAEAGSIGALHHSHCQYGGTRGRQPQSFRCLFGDRKSWQKIGHRAHSGASCTTRTSFDSNRSDSLSLGFYRYIKRICRLLPMSKQWCSQFVWSLWLICGTSAFAWQWRLATSNMAQIVGQQLVLLHATVYKVIACVR